MSIYATDENNNLYKISGGSGTKVTVNGQGQREWSADFVENEKTISGENNSNPITHNNDAPVVFAESERQKSKNLLVYPYTGEVYQYGVTFTDNGDGSFTINGQQTDPTVNSYHYMETADTFKLSAGTYTLKAFADTSVTGWDLVLYDGTFYHDVSSSNIAKTLIFNEDKYCRVYIQVPKTSTTIFNNFVVRPILVKGTEVGDWQPYNGAIVHEKEAERYDIVYDEKIRQTPLGGTLAYTNGIYGTVEMDLSKYRFIRVYYGHNNKQYTMIINCDIGKNGSGLQLATDTNILATLVSCTTTSFTLVKNGYYVVPNMTFTDRTSDSGNDGTYSVYRIEGVY